MKLYLEELKESNGSRDRGVRIRKKAVESRALYLSASRSNVAGSTSVDDMI